MRQFGSSVGEFKGLGIGAVSLRLFELVYANGEACVEEQLKRAKARVREIATHDTPYEGLQMRTLLWVAERGRMDEATDFALSICFQLFFSLRDEGHEGMLRKCIALASSRGCVLGRHTLNVIQSHDMLRPEETVIAKDRYKCTRVAASRDFVMISPRQRRDAAEEPRVPSFWKRLASRGRIDAFPK